MSNLLRRPTGTVGARTRSPSDDRAPAAPHGAVDHAPPAWQSYAFPAVAAAAATPFTNQFAVAKTHLQARGARYRGMGDFFRRSLAAEGLSCLGRGLLPVALREASMNVFRIGLYAPLLRRLHAAETPAPSWKRMVAGAGSGALGFFACNPFEIVRVKVMARPLGSPVATGQMAARIFRDNGIAGFYKAGGSSVALGMVCTSVNLTTYTLFREAAAEEYGETVAVDALCALASGFLAALAMNPIDVVRTRLWTQPALSPACRGGPGAAAAILRNEGATAFLKGFVPSFLRIGPHFVLTFVLLEQMRRLARLPHADLAPRHVSYPCVHHHC